MASVRKPWANADNQLWWFVNNKREHLPYVRVERIDRHYRDPLNDPECRDYTVILSGPLSEYKWLMDITGKETFEIADNPYGDPSIFNPDQVVMRFKDCKPVSSWMEAVTIADKRYAEEMTAYAEIACQVEFLLENR